MLIVNDYEFEMIKNKTGLSDAELAALAGLLIITRGEKGSTIITDERHDRDPGGGAAPPGRPHRAWATPTGPASSRA